MNETIMDAYQEAITCPFPMLLKPLELPPSINWPNEKEHLTWIYGLSDPRDGALRAIGRSVNPTTVLHLAEVIQGEVGNPSPRQEWLMELASVYRFPATTLLACVPDDWAEDYKRTYVEAAVSACPTILTPFITCNWRMNEDHADRILREAWWVLWHAYPGHSPIHPDAVEPLYDINTRIRLARPPLTRTGWRRLKEEMEKDAEESLTDFDYYWGVIQARERGIPLLGEKP